MTQFQYYPKGSVISLVIGWPFLPLDVDNSYFQKSLLNCSGIVIIPTAVVPIIIIACPVIIIIHCARLGKGQAPCTD